MSDGAPVHHRPVQMPHTDRRIRVRRPQGSQQICGSIAVLRAAPWSASHARPSGADGRSVTSMGSVARGVRRQAGRSRRRPQAADRRGRPCDPSPGCCDAPVADVRRRCGCRRTRVGHIHGPDRSDRLLGLRGHAGTLAPSGPGCRDESSTDGADRERCQDSNEQQDGLGGQVERHLGDPNSNEGGDSFSVAMGATPSQWVERRSASRSSARARTLRPDPMPRDRRLRSRHGAKVHHSIEILPRWRLGSALSD